MTLPAELQDKPDGVHGDLEAFVAHLETGQEQAEYDYQRKRTMRDLAEGLMQ